MALKNGNLWKEKKEYIIERFTTQTGLVDFFIGSWIWGFFIVKYIELVKQKSFEFWLNSIPLNFLANYLSYLTIGVIFSALGLLISFIIIWSFTKVKKCLRK